MPQRDLDVSVIIPAHRAADTIAACLQSVLASEGVSFEVIVVDDASDDATVEIARQFDCRILALASNIMSANCRNLGARHARGKTLVFFDADETMPPDTLRRLVGTLDADPELDAVVASLTPDTPMRGFFSRFKNFQHHWTHQTANREGATLDSGRMAIRRRTFEQLGGFEPSFGPASIEDIALGYRMVRAGHRIRFEPSIQVTHLKAYTASQMVRSDILYRAIPWTGLMLRERFFRSDLNTRSGNVASVAAAWLLLAAIAAGVAGLPAGWWVGALSLASMLALNRRFLLDGGRHFGTGFALRAAAFLPVMYFYQGLGLALGLIAYAGGRSVSARRTAPAPEFRVHEPGASE